LGAIVVGWAESGPILTAQEELLKQFADQAVIAIENVRLFDEVQARTEELSESLRQQTATAEVLRLSAGRCSTSSASLRRYWRKRCRVRPIAAARLGRQHHRLDVCASLYGGELWISIPVAEQERGTLL